MGIKKEGCVLKDPLLWDYYIYKKRLSLPYGSIQQSQGKQIINTFEKAAKAVASQ